MLILRQTPIELISLFLSHVTEILLRTSLVVDKNGNVVGKDWVTKLGQSYVESDVETCYRIYG